MPPASKHVRRKFDKQRAVHVVNEHQDIYITSELALNASMNTLREFEHEAHSARSARELATDLKKLVDQLDAILSTWLPAATAHTRAQHEQLHARFWAASEEKEMNRVAEELFSDRSWLLWHENRLWPHPGGVPEPIRREVFRDAVVSLRDRTQQKLDDLRSQYILPLLKERGRPRLHPSIAHQIELMFDLGLSDGQILTKLRNLTALKLAPGTREAVRQHRRRWRRAGDAKSSK
jgi:hypothetical protein